MKKIILALAVISLPFLSYAQKSPKRSFLTENSAAGIVWQDGDLVSFPDGDDGSGVIYAAERSEDMTYFAGRGACRSDEGYWWALYPASALKSWDSEWLRFVIPHEQVIGEVQVPMYSRTDDSALEFKPLTAYLQFCLAPGQPPVKEIRILADKYISGDYKAALDAKTVSVQLDTGTRFRDIVLKPKEGEVIVPGEYSMPIFARVLPDGIRVEIVSEDGRVEVRTIAKELSFKLGKTRDIGVIDNLKFDDGAQSQTFADGDYPQTEAGKTLKSDLCPKIADVLWDTTYTVTPGLDYYQLIVLTETNEKLDLYLLRTDPSKGLDVRAAVAGESTTSTWKRQIPSEMAAHMDSPSNPVYALVNADFCENRKPIRPRGPLHSDGKEWVASYSIDPRFPQQALSYVGVTYEGKMLIATNAEYQSARKSLKECTGAGVILLRNSEIQGGYVNDESYRDPRTAIGYTPDNIVWILAVDGRHKGTKGMTYMEMAHIFRALGCEAAVNLDGGGSTQMLVRDPQTGKMVMRNWPSDPTAGFGGRERARLNGWVIMKH